MPSATIKLFLVHGDATRLRIAETSNWTGMAVAGPRSELDALMAHRVLNRHNKHTSYSGHSAHFRRSRRRGHVPSTPSRQSA